MKRIFALTVAAIIIIFGIYVSYNSRKEDIVDEAVDEVINYDEAQNIELSQSNGKINITSGGIYSITGVSDNASITIDTEEQVNLILDNVDLTSQNGPVILVENADKMVITLKDGTKNVLTDNEHDSADYDAVIYSKDDLVINGDGELIINANFENGIKSNDDLEISSGNISINSKTNGVVGNDFVTIVSGNITITSGGDAIKSSNDTDVDKGNVIIEGGNIVITSSEDGIQAENDLTITGGVINITTGKGSAILSDSDLSLKGLKAGGNIIISNGTFEINCNDDGIHSDKNVKIDNGSFTIKSTEDGIHGDGLVEIDNGNMDITASEGIEATYVKINDGTINISASDDGINSGNKSSEYTPTIEINGGYITIKMGQGDTDGIDSNGNLYINGGIIDITGQSPFDYDGEAKYTGGKMIVNGSETTEITNQFMGQGMMPGMQDKNMNDGMQQGGFGQREMRR